MKLAFATLGRPTWSLERIAGEAARMGFDGVEWEKKWHPDLAEPEVAFPHFAAFARRLMSAAE